MTMLEGQFAVIAGRIDREGEQRPHGDLLRASLSVDTLACRECGELPASGDWIVICHDAMDHVRETGHQVVVQQVQAALYGHKCSTCRDKGKVEIPEPDGTGLYDQACPDCATPYPVTGDPDAEDPFTADVKPEED